LYYGLAFDPAGFADKVRHEGELVSLAHEGTADVVPVVPTPRDDVLTIWEPTFHIEPFHLPDRVTDGVEQHVDVRVRVAQWFVQVDRPERGNDCLALQHLVPKLRVKFIDALLDILYIAWILGYATAVQMLTIGPLSANLAQCGTGGLALVIVLRTCG
jgi:hypothetical protein